MIEDFKIILYQDYIFKLVFKDDSELPINKSSMFRGGIGEMLLRKHCIMDRDCDNCGFKDECVVRNVFYHPMRIRPDFVQGKENAGFIVECNDLRSGFNAGDKLEFTITLFGDVIIHFSSIMDAVYMLGQLGAGADKVRYDVISITNSTGNLIMRDNQVYLKNAAPRIVGDYVDQRFGELRGENNELKVRMKLLSPCTIKRNGELRYEFDEDTLISSISRRVYLLNCFEGNDANQYGEFDDSISILEQSTRKVTVARYSSTHDSKLYLTGFVGELSLKVKADFLPFLIAGEILHIGKNVSMGFGKYRLTSI